jgi:hypothetical protein
MASLIEIISGVRFPGSLSATLGANLVCDDPGLSHCWVPPQDLMRWMTQD